MRTQLRAPAEALGERSLGVTKRRGALVPKRKPTTTTPDYVRVRPAVGDSFAAERPGIGRFHHWGLIMSKQSQMPLWTSYSQEPEEQSLSFTQTSHAVWQ